LNTLPKVIIACAWYQRAEYIRDTVDSLLAQAYDNFEVVIINDGSPDPRVREIFNSYTDPRLSVVHQGNTGFTVAIKKAISLKASEYFCVIGSGDRVTPDKLAIQVEYLETHPQVGAVGSGHVLVSAKNKRRISYHKPMLRLQPNVLRRKVPFTHGTIMYRRSKYDEAGGYDPFFRVAQDRDLYWRLSKVSEIHAIDKPLYEKYLFEDGVTFNPSMVAIGQFYVNLARQQDHKTITYYKHNMHLLPTQQQADLPQYIWPTIKRIPAMLVRREWSLVKTRCKLIVAQLLRSVKISGLMC
jgi:glycosyltransferase involved in cell wall biosynthesis